ncbi:F0F1 ATP synthase subunit A, partial [Treponema sp. R6D11]
LILIVVSLAIARKFKEVPTGSQAILETGIEFVNNFAKDQFGSFAKHLGPYMGSLFLFLLLANILPVLSPLAFKAFGHEFTPPFEIRPPTRDINVTSALAIISILLVLVCGFAARGVKGWFKKLFKP